MNKFPKHKLYEVTWIDAWESSAQYYYDYNEYTPMLCKDVGYVVEENDDCLVMATSISPSCAPRHVNVLPWEFIVNMEELV